MKHRYRLKPDFPALFIGRGSQEKQGKEKRNDGNEEVWEPDGRCRDEGGKLGRDCRNACRPWRKLEVCGSPAGVGRPGAGLETHVYLIDGPPSCSPRRPPRQNLCSAVTQS